MVPATYKGQDTSRFDNAFKKSGASFGVPWLLLKSFAWHESAMNPDASPGKGSSATGMFQILKATLGDFNGQSSRKVQYTLDDMKDPEKGSEVAAWLINTIVKSYAKNHPQSLWTDWRSGRFISLVAQGYNAGWSEEAGVGYVIGKMEATKIAPEKMTPVNVGQAAQTVTPKGSKYLWESARNKYANDVADDYLALLVEDDLQNIQEALPALPDTLTPFPTAQKPAQETVDETLFWTPGKVAAVLVGALGLTFAIHSGSK